MAARPGLKSLINSDKCGIYYDEDGETTLKIENILSSHERVLLVCDDAYVHSYTNIRNISHLSAYEIIRTGAITARFQIPASKFIFLIQFGYIRMNCFDYVILRLFNVKKELACCFRQFCAGDRSLQEMSDVKVNVFLKEIGDSDPLFIGLRNQSAGREECVVINKKEDRKKYGNSSNFFAGDEVFPDIDTFFSETGSTDEEILGGFCIEDKNPKNEATRRENATEERSTARFRLLMVEPAYTPLIEKYLSVKILLISCIKQTGSKEMTKLLKEATQIECVSFKLAFELIRTRMELKGVKSRDFQEIMMFSDIKQMLVNEMKFLKITQILEETSTKIFLVAENKDIFGMVREDLRARLLNPLSFTSEELEKESRDSILIFYDHIHINLAKILFREIVVLHLLGSDFGSFFQIKEAQNQMPAEDPPARDETEFIRLTKEQEPRFIIRDTNANVLRSMAYQMLTNFFYLLKNYLGEHMLFIKDMSIQCQHERVGTEFVCSITLPYLHDHLLFVEAQKSGLHSSKKSAQHEISSQLFKHLYKEGFMDNNFFPTEIFVRENKVYNAYLREVYGTVFQDEISQIKRRFHKEKDPFLSSDQIEILFKKKYSLFLNAGIKKTKQGRFVARASPKCLSSYPERFHVYVFSEEGSGDEDLGICCGASFEGGIHAGGVRIEYLYSAEFTLDELDLIFFFQVLFFGLHFKKIREFSEGGQSCCYLAVPIKRGRVDFQLLRAFSADFLKSSVYEQTDSTFQNFLVFNPVTKVFFTYHSEFDSTIMEKVIPVKGRKFFAKDGVTEYASYAQYFEEKYKTELLYKVDEKRLLFRGSFYTGKGESQAYSVLSSEILHVTPIRKDFFKQYAMFVSCFFRFEEASLAFDLKTRLGLEISVQGIMVALTPKKGRRESEDTCYERYEFLGDSVLKYVSTKHLFLSNHKSLVEVVRAKDSIVCNANLQKVAEDLGIPEHLVLLGPSEKLFRPPSLFCLINTIGDKTYKENMQEYIRYFKVERVFQTGNQEGYLQSMQSGEEELAARHRKIYADILEAIIGIYFLEKGLEGASDFIYRVGILPEERLYLPENMKNHNKVLEIHEISLVEYKLGYVFRNKGLLEKAIIHPSSHNNIFGSSNFQNLELLGDCSLEILVTRDIFHRHPEFGPGELNDQRKSLVNNFSLARMLFHLELVPHIHTCFPDDYLTRIQDKITEDGNRVNKMFGDIFEAICGAVLVDLDFDMEQFSGFLSPLIPVLEKCADHTK